MEKKYTPLTDPLYEYLQSVSLREPEVLLRLRMETSANPYALMQIAPDQGQFMALLARLMGARRYLEIGVFTGYSALSMALALPADGEITACDISEEWTAIARRYWREAGVGAKIDLRLGPAKDTLASLLENGAEGSYDMAFIDADKENYQVYFEYCLKLVRPGGLILIDNVLWDGRVIDETDTDESTLAIKEFNHQLQKDDRVSISMLPVVDGLTLARLPNRVDH